MQFTELRTVVVHICDLEILVLDLLLAMDIKALQGIYNLVLVDLAIRYCKPMVVANKTTSTIVSALFTSWITSFGAPQQFLSDRWRIQ